MSSAFSLILVGAVGICGGLVLFNIENGRMSTCATQCCVEWWLLDEY